MSGYVSFDSHKSIIYVEANVFKGDGFVKADFVLDTGSSTTMVSTDIVAALGYDISESKRRARIITGSGVVYGPIITVDKIESIGKVVNNIDVVCRDLPEEAKIDGLLGLNFLKHFDTLISYSKETITLSEFFK